MIPAFWPPIEPGDREWPGLEAMAAYGFRNRPGAYHNGGRWPMVNGFYGLALLSVGDRDGARAVLEHIRAAGFAEYIDTDGSPGGASPTTWSAAAEVWLSAALDTPSHPEEEP
jgi:glycogen debranching enzyme